MRIYLGGTHEIDQNNDFNSILLLKCKKKNKPMAKKRISASETWVVFLLPMGGGFMSKYIKNISLNHSYYRPKKS